MVRPTVDKSASSSIYEATKYLFHGGKEDEKGLQSAKEVEAKIQRFAAAAAETPDLEKQGETKLGHDFSCISRIPDRKVKCAATAGAP